MTKNGLSRRQFGAAGALLGIAPGLLTFGGEALARTAPRAGVPIDPRTLVDPELEPMLKMIGGAPQMGKISLETLPQLRAMQGLMAVPELPDVPVTQRTIPGRAGQPDVTIYIINAKPGASRPGILHTHGGGYVAGSAKASVPAMQKFAKAADASIVSVEYRLAPEVTYVGSVEDNYAALKWLHRNGAELGVDPARLAVMGDSAGGGHAALLAIAARDRGEVPLAMQILTYPMLDDRTGASRTMPSHIGTIIWTPDANRFGWRSFLGREPGGRGVPAAGVPARTESLAGLPKTFIAVGAIDLFVTEDLEYAGRLIESGVPTELLVLPGAFHGFDFVETAGVARHYQQARLAAFRRWMGKA